MKNVLIVANTYYQLIVALQLRFTLFKNDIVVLLLSDHSNGAEYVAKKLINIECFTQTKFIRTQYLSKKKSLFEKFANAYENISVKKNRYKSILEGISGDIIFDEIIAFNIDILICNLFAILYEKNKRLVVSGYEEGLLSYNTQQLHFPGFKQICCARNIIGKKGMNQAFGNFYCFFPQLYKGILQAVKVPLIDKDSPAIDILRNIFDVQGKDLIYTQKYIYFSSVYDFEGGKPIGEFELVRNIAKQVGKENLIVKVHPRDTRPTYAEEGFLVDKNSSKPWEVIQLLGDFSNKVFLTATSGSVLAGNFLTTLPVPTFYMYKFCDISGNNTALKTVSNIKALLQEKTMKKVFFHIKTAESIEDIN